MLVPSLERGDFDIAMNGLEVTDARRGRVAFSRPYYVFTETLVVRRGERGAATLADLRGRRVGTLEASLAFDLLSAVGGLDVVRYEGVEEPYLDLERRRLDAVLLDNIIAARYGLPRPTLEAAGTFGEGTYAIAVRPSEAALLTAVDGALASMMQAGELRQILEHWKLWDARQAGLGASIQAATGDAPARTLAGFHVGLFLRGAVVTIVISTVAMVLAVTGGLVLSLVRRYGPPAAQAAATVYVEVMRGTPVLLQLYVIYFGLAPILTLDAFTAAVLGLGLNYAAYEAELYRAGFEAVPAGQTEAALALGMSRGLTLRRVILPQALRVALPGVANDFIALLKDSSLVSVITVVELTKQMTITAVDVRGWLAPGLLCAALYLAMSYPLSRLARRLERRLAPVPA
jgi:polar amino acid transport system substrate-binding protein